MIGNGSGLIGIIALVAAIWVIYEVWANNKKDSTGIKVVWTVCAVFFSIVTAIVYFILRKR